MEQKTVLVVEDDTGFVRALDIRLSAEGFEVVSAMDATQAVMMAHHHEPDVIILDIRIPGGGGFAVMDKLGGSLKTKGIPIIVVTAFDDELTKERVGQLGAFGFFRKPFDSVRLLEAVREAASRV